MFELNTYSATARDLKVQFQVIILIVIGAWLISLTAALFWILKVFNNLTKEVKGESLIRVLEKVLAKIEWDTKEIGEVKKEIGKIKDLDRLHLQKVGMVRFNPFRETGGDHSFTVALLDATDTGLVLTGIHTRERTRIYTKAIINGKGEFELSENERKALVRAQKTRD